MLLILVSSQTMTAYVRYLYGQLLSTEHYCARPLDFLGRQRGHERDATCRAALFDSSYV